jgi:hypothetical protein
MEPEIVTAFDPETGATDVLVNGVGYMRVNADLTIDGFAGTLGDREFVNGQTFPLRTKEYMEWVTELASKNPPIPIQ